MILHIKEAVKTELHISAYNDRIRLYLEELIRAVGRRTQIALWGRQCDDTNPKSLLVLDSGGDLKEAVGAANLEGAVYKEYIIFKSDGRPVHIITSAKANMNNEESEMFASLLFKRCAFIDSKKYTVFAAVDGDPILKNPNYCEIYRAAKGAVEHGHFIERSYVSLTEREWMNSVGVFIADEYTHNAVFLAMTGKDEPCIMHVGTENADVYIPFSSIRPVCFVPHKKAMMEAIYSVAMWLFDSGLPSPSKRLCTVTAETESPWNVAYEFENRVKRPEKEGEPNEGNEDQT